MTIPRMHLFEFEDQSWFPGRLRDFMTDYLRFVMTKLKIYRHTVPILAKAIRHSGSSKIVDLCSGGSGPVRPLLAELADQGLAVRITLTDRYPNVAAFERVTEASAGAVDYVRAPIDARAVPPTLEGFRTFHNSFHHFEPADARAILLDAVSANQPIGIFEWPSRTLGRIVPLVLVPLAVLIFTPFLRPRRLDRFLWTYLIRVVPLAVFWDGLVSHLRAYTMAELRTFAEAVEAGHYVWEIGESRVQSVPGKVTYLVGYPAPPEIFPPMA